MEIISIDDDIKRINKICEDAYMADISSKGCWSSANAAYIRKREQLTGYIYWPLGPIKDWPKKR